MLNYENIYDSAMLMSMLVRVVYTFSDALTAALKMHESHVDVWNAMLPHLSLPSIFTIVY